MESSIEGANVNSETRVASTLPPFIRAMIVKGIPISPPPVSYTHLDVYKRQGLFRAVPQFRGVIDGGVWNPERNSIYVSFNQDKDLFG